MSTTRQWLRLLLRFYINWELAFAIALHGREKLDEAGLADKTDLAIVSNQQMHLLQLDPKDLGVNPAPISALRGGDVL